MNQQVLMMTKEDIIRMAREAGMPEWLQEDWFADPFDSFALRFAALVAAEEREACAKTAMEFLFTYIGSYPINEQFADAIRARGQE
jgi:hypothetical protein